MLNRRLFLALAGALPLRAARFSKPIGINLYTVRDSLAKDARARIRRFTHWASRSWKSAPTICGITAISSVGMR